MCMRIYIFLYEQMSGLYDVETAMEKGVFIYIFMYIYICMFIDIKRICICICIYI
jgi:hypothetical protein